MKKKKLKISYHPDFLKDCKKLKLSSSGFGIDKEYVPSFLEKYVLWPLEAYWEKITNIPKEIKWFIQRGKRGYADSDVWDLHYYLTDIIPPAIRQLRDETSGYPDNPFHKEGCFPNMRSWKKVLTVMANKLEAGNQVANSDYTKRQRIQAEKDFKEGFQLLEKYFFNLWD